MRKFILVDDEPYITSTLATKLTRGGDAVRTACDGEEGFALALEDVPDLIVTDYQMPNMNGFEMSCALKDDARTARVPVLMLTARGHHLSPTELARTNIRYMLPKPFSLRELLSRVEELLAAEPSHAAAAAALGGEELSKQEVA